MNLIFKVEENLYALHHDIVKEILPVPKITPLPRSANYMEGVANIRGDIYIVLNLPKIFGMDHVPKMMVLLDQCRAGILVDSIEDVLDLESYPKDTSLANEIISGHIQYKDKIIAELNLSCIIG